MTGKYVWIFFLYLQFQLFKADRMSLSSPFLTDAELTHVPEKCAKLLNTFAQSASNLTMCSIIYARPVRLCEKCVDYYVDFVMDYKTLLDAADNGTTCRSIFISRDRLDAVLEYHDTILAIWDKGNCNDCYDWDGTIPIISNKTTHFNKMHNITMDCILDNLNPYGNNTDAVCEKCMQSYVQLDEFYKTMSKDSIGVDSVCMDVVDLMNTTRSIWSKNLDCCKLRKAPEVIFLCCTAIVSILPLLFYLAVRYCGPIRDLPNVLKQSRFKQTILRSINGGIN